jgi:hypothetical protein
MSAEVQSSEDRIKAAEHDWQKSHSSSICSRPSTDKVKRRISVRREVDVMQDELLDTHGVRYTYLRLRNFVFGPVLEMFFAALIIFNALVIAIDSQYRSFDMTHKLYMQGVWPHGVNQKHKERVWPGADIALVILEMFFGLAFTLEVLFKCGLDIRRFVKSLWNWFDTLVVGFWILSVFGLGLDSNPMLLRLLRLARVIRLLRLVKSIQVFDVLHLLVKTLKASWSVLMWSVVMLLCVTWFGALVLNFVLEDFLQDESNSMQMRRDVYERFGSFTRALVSMFELTLGNWQPPVFVLQEINDWWAVGCLVYICIVWFAIVQVIRGVFINETFKVAASDDELMIMQKNRQIEEHQRNMEQFMMEADVDGDGFVSLEEFLDILQDTRVKTWIAAMGVDIRDAEQVFNLLDHEGDQQLSHQEIVQGVAKLKGGATAVDIMVLNKRFDEIHRACKRMERELIGLERQISP